MAPPRLPAKPEELLDFAGWLERDSADGPGRQRVAVLRAVGHRLQHRRPHQLANELLEADGRTAGGLATLRFRPLAGERRQITELAYDARKLGKQVERLSAVLDASPLPVWLRDADGKLVWVNRAYVAAGRGAGQRRGAQGGPRDRQRRQHRPLAGQCRRPASSAASMR